MKTGRIVKFDNDMTGSRCIAITPAVTTLQATKEYGGVVLGNHGAQHTQEKFSRSGLYSTQSCENFVKDGVVWLGVKWIVE